MTQFYTDETREADAHALPDAEVFWGYMLECTQCGESEFQAPDYYGTLRDSCEACGESLLSEDNIATIRRGRRYFYAFGFPGCLWDSEPVGPFDTEAEAVEAARESASE